MTEQLQGLKEQEELLRHLRDELEAAWYTSKRIYLPGQESLTLKIGGIIYETHAKLTDLGMAIRLAEPEKVKA
jgi:hypothetical protein